jgi:hypothetical protein
VGQFSLFGSADGEPEAKPPGDQGQRLKVLITVKAAPNPSEKYGETVCVAGFNLDVEHPGWLRLYPINFRELTSEESFAKYDVVEVDAAPARNDARAESWRPRMHTLARVGHLAPWRPRERILASAVEDSMCRLVSGARESVRSKSLALIAPKVVQDLVVEAHPGWTPEQQAKIDQYVLQERLGDERDRTPLQAPRFRAFYRYRCAEQRCPGHRQGVLDWELVALQRNQLAHLDDGAAVDSIREKFLEMMCAPHRAPAFYVGNQAKRAHVFSVLGVYYPTR